MTLTVWKQALSSYRESLDQVWHYLLEARSYRSVPRQLVDVILHKLLINTSPIDYYRFEFYKGTKTWEEKSRYIGKRASTYYPYEKNLIGFVPLFDNKLIFKTLVAGFNLPQPRLFAAIGGTYEIRTKGPFCSLVSVLRRDIVIKPILGTHGRGILVLSYVGDTYFDGKVSLSPEDLWSYLREGRENGYIVEERAVNTEAISRFYPSSLNTFRVVTIRTDDNQWHVAVCGLKLGSNGRRIDNVSAGGIRLYLDASGKVIYAHDWTQNRAIYKHPDTGIAVTGIQIEGFNDVRELALRASRKFGFMGTVGWDIALTDRGPLIIEGNPFYDCFYPQIGPAGGLVSEEIASGLRKRNLFSRWDRTRIHPRFNRYRITG